MGDLWELCAGSSLFVFNGVDLVCGVVLSVYSLYLGRPSLCAAPGVCLQN